MHQSKHFNTESTEKKFKPQIHTENILIIRACMQDIAHVTRNFSV
jgi:hypothetical protein